MERKPKIGIVAGDLAQPRFLALFEPLKEAFDTCVYTLQQDRLLTQGTTSLKVKMFENIADMPGFMRGLEEELASSDLIIGIETSRLATFQAVRAARKYSVPICVVVNEFTPYFYEKFVNIRAIQFDICNKAERFWATSHAAEINLKLDQVPEESIGRLAPIIDTTRFKRSSEGRKRFRQYVGIGEHEIVILFHQDLSVANKPEELLKTLGLLNRQFGVQAGSLRLLFAGNGPLTMDLKYKSFDLGLGKQVMFLHQDCEPFLVDLYSACDVQLLARPTAGEFHEELPLAALEGMACGLLPLVSAGSVAAELTAGQGLIYGDSTYQNFAAQLQQLLTSPVAVEAARVRATLHIQNCHAPEVVGRIFVQEVRDVLASTAKRRYETPHPAAIIARIREELAKNDLAEALLLIEEAFLLDIRAPNDRAELFRCKGDVYYARGDMDGSSSCYLDGLKLDERNSLCLRGLGFVAWQGHSNEEALMYFRKALALDDRDGEIMFGIGLVFRRLGLNDDALFWLEKCVIGFNLASGIVALAQTCSQLSRPQVGIQVLARVIEAIGDNHTLMMALGQLYLAEGRAAEGHALLQKALECA